ncbi:sugar transferase [Larkinella insperata]|uniref:Sugar transferase n=1 Tax=Larkinella insperata TaxID=332158 RepID=A0ABW3Q3D6_9BACT|nr:sugar transferase [Larkinella insperata]
MVTYHDSQVGEFLQEKTTVQTDAYSGKRMFDILVSSLVILLFLSWLLPLLAVCVKLTSPGPVFYRQMRTGRRNRPFYCYKIRTMVSCEQTKFQQAVPNDPRITSLGKWLRNSSLDELPQFFNVLLGDMSLVGPRPHAVMHDAMYWTTMPNYPKRYASLPGITGLAQVRGARGMTDCDSKMQHRLRYDLFYIKKQSFRLDAQICWWTIGALVKGDKNAI